MKKVLILMLVFLPTCMAMAGEKDSLDAELAKVTRLIDSVNKAMHYATGHVKLPVGIAELNVPKGFKFLNAEQSKYVLTELWGNPPRTDIMGMIFPENGGPFVDSSYAFIVSYDEMGYVKDEDADKIDYDDMLKETHKEEPEINKERNKLGYESIHFVKWAQKPFYDKSKKVLHWAKELQFGTESGSHTLNYDVRILGRKGVLSLNAVSTMEELPMVKADIDAVLSMASFTTGNTYEDFNPEIDKVAAWTIGSLVAGKVLLKVGFFAIIGKFLVAGWKFILIGLVALGGFFRKLFTRKKNEEEGIVEEVAQEEATPAAIEEQATSVADTSGEQGGTATESSSSATPDEPKQ